MQKHRTGSYDVDSLSVQTHRGSPIPGPSHTCRNSPIRIPSESESENGWKPLIRHKRIRYAYDSSTESENSIPPAKHHAIRSKEAVKMRHKRIRYAYDSSTESENSVPPSKHHAIGSKDAVKMLKDIKCAMDKYHEEVKHFRLWRELDEQKSAIIFAFSCLICKDVVSPDNTPVVPPCCRAAVMCKECLISWLDNQASCPHCREPLVIDDCLSMPPLRPLFDVLSKCKE